MARKLRVQFPGAIYHVTIRGVERRSLFLDNHDRERFLSQVADAVDLDGVRLYLYCLMTNHVHLVLETPRANLSQFMHRVQTAYTIYFNLRHDRAGHLMQDRFGSVPVAGDDHLLKLTRYVHLNPVYAGRMKQAPLQARVDYLRRYPWSTYPGYVGRAKPKEFVDYGPVLAQVGGRGRKRRRDYRRFVEAGLAETDQEFVVLLKERRWGLGDDEFAATIRDLHMDLTRKHAHPEDVSFRRAASLLGDETILTLVAEALNVGRDTLRRQSKSGWGRPIAARMLGKYAGLRQREVASRLGLKTGAAVCLQMKRLQIALDHDGDLRKRLTALERQLEKRLPPRLG